MSSELIHKLVKGPDTERAVAAKELCLSKRTDLIDELIANLTNIDPKVRESICSVLGVLGGQKSEQYLEAVAKNDPESNVRIAAIISKEFLGKTSYENLQYEIKKFRGDQPSVLNENFAAEAGGEDKSAEARAARAEKQSIEKEEKKHSPFNKNRLLISAASVLLISLIFVIYSSINESGQNDISRPMKGDSLAKFINDRILAIDNFKKTSLNPIHPDSKRPMTLEIRTISGDTYGELFDRIYSNTLFTVTGMNTLGAFWRNINFGAGSRQNLVNLMEQETEGELLLFPNYPAMSIPLTLEEGTVAHHTQNNDDSELEINIRINNVIVR